MRYAINVNGCVNIRDGETPFPEGSVWPVPGEFETLDLSTVKITSGQLVMKTEEELRIQALPAKYRTDGGLDADGNQVWLEKTPEEKAQADADEAAAAAAAEQAWQEAKSPALKALENIYVDFLASMWTPALRSAGIIAPDYTITVANTDEATNMYFLMQLRVLDYTVYDRMASEFLRLKTAIVGNGGIMSRVIQHV